MDKGKIFAFVFNSHLVVTIFYNDSFLLNEFQ
jgi:hypothetical protein